MSLANIVVIAGAVIIAITFHEASHGYVAHRLGDDTAWRMGRVTFNPFRHIDPFGSILLPFFLFKIFGIPFGYAKPVPVNFAELRNPRRDMVLVAAAGPAMNILLAFASALLMHAVLYLPPRDALPVLEALDVSIQANLVLAVFNMIPLPPLDGGRVAVGLLPYGLASRLARAEGIGILIVMAVVVILPALGRQLGYEIHVAEWLLGPPVEYLRSLVLRLSGLGALS